MGGVITIESDNNLYSAVIKGNVKKDDKVYIGDDVEFVKNEYDADKYIIQKVYERRNQKYNNQNNNNKQ